MVLFSTLPVIMIASNRMHNFSRVMGDESLKNALNRLARSFVPSSKAFVWAHNSAVTMMDDVVKS